RRCRRCSARRSGPTCSCAPMCHRSPIASACPARVRRKCLAKSANARTGSDGTAVRRLTAAEVIARLALKPHPEGGHFRETFRDPVVDARGRAASTAIYFLLARAERSHWHRIDAAETWHYYTGASLALSIAFTGKCEQIRLGTDLAAGERPQAIVPAHAW